ncbi:unnamed protein product [Phaedon cochleariae]|uniref:DUF4806 domain-containing protein n=1 Tax=Phaedon cochleariae TaxID=80249 RepID=A0A9N9SIY0_PHACE|nr:unnamed protein product [Phaedon cochleariae]
MSFAVVKFISENSDTDEEIVSEIPISWLTKNNTFCKWPPEKYCSLYISRSFPPEENWIEYPVAVEYICDTLTEAKQKAKGNIEVEDVGRGCRTIKPLEYFSPAEEEEKARGQRKKEGKTVSKKDNPNSTERNYHADFMTFLNREANSEETNPIINEDSGSDSLSEQDQTSNLDLQPAVAINNIQLKSIEGTGSLISGHSSPTTSTVKDDQMKKFDEKLDSICNFLATLKLDLEEIKEKMDTMTPQQKFEIEKFPFQPPFKSLTEIEELEQYLSIEEQRKCYIQFLRNIGGNDHKDYTTRICKSLLTNTVAELCSWLGRKNNFAVGHLQCTNLAFGVVHHKTRCSRKEFETVFSEWLRHAKQRRLREKN